MDIREQLSNLEHERWSGWMIYMFGKGVLNEDGTWTMPKWAVERWSRQTGMEYIGLTEKEKDSDRKEADKTLAIVKTHRKEALREAVALLDDLWNCNCVTDESLGRSKCECVDAPANKSGVRKLIEDADNPRPGE